jgi:hypothetical protein
LIASNIAQLSAVSPEFDSAIPRQGFTDVVEADLSGYFRAIPHKLPRPSSTLQFPDRVFYSKQSGLLDGYHPAQESGEVPEYMTRTGRSVRSLENSVCLPRNWLGIGATGRQNISP